MSISAMTGFSQTNKQQGSVELLMFDFDGTIADSMHAAFTAFNRIASEYGLEPLSTSDVQRIRQYGLGELFSRAKIAPHRLPSLIRRVFREMRVNSESIKPVAGIDEVIRTLHRRGYRFALITSQRHDMVASFLHTYDLAHFEDLVTGSRLFGKAAKLRRVLAECSVAPGDALYVGDEVRDIEAAHAAQVGAVACTWGFNTQEALKRVKPEYVVTSPGDLLRLFPEASPHGSQE